MKKRLLFLVLVFVCLSGTLTSQTLYDTIRKALLDEKLGPINSLKAALSKKLESIAEARTPEEKALAQVQETALQKLLEYLNAQEKTIIDEIKKIKFESIKLGGKFDFKSEKGSAIAFNMEYRWEKWNFHEKLVISPVLSFALKMNNEATSYEGTGGLRFDFPILIYSSGPFVRVGLGEQIQTGDKPDALVGLIAIGLAIKIKQSITIEPELVFNRASKAIYAEDTENKKNDMGLNISISFNFARSKNK